MLIQRTSCLLRSSPRIRAFQGHSHLSPTWSFSQATDGRYFSSSTPSNEPFRVAIVGSGPSGCYTAKYLQSKKALGDQEMHIDVLERLPTPYGLVRFGVAPDHPEVKNVEHDFDKVFEEHRDGMRFFGNVTVGKDVSVEELRQRYHAVVLSYGCESDRRLELPGSDSSGILSAREFVAWYNGHPDFDHIGPLVKAALKESGGSVLVIGQGNVALDCARILAKTPKQLVGTDIATRALDVLNEVTNPIAVHVVGRRGHVQGAFTIKELRELTKLMEEDEEGASFHVRQDELELGLTESSKVELNAKGGRPKVRISTLLEETAKSTAQADSQIHLRFLMRPNAYEADESGNVSAVVCERTSLDGEPWFQRAVGTGEIETIPAQLVLVSIGYKGVPIPGMETWYDLDRGVLKNEHGRVDAPSSDGGGLYVAGWLKRGPSGIIGTNITDAKDTVATIQKDLEAMQSDGTITSSSENDISQLLKDRGCRVIDWDGVQRIVAAETNEERKRTPEQPREKIVSVDELLDVALK